MAPEHPTSQDPQHTVIAQTVRLLLDQLGYNVGHPDIERTPDRVARFWAFFTHPKPHDFTVFDANGYDQMVIERQIPFYSMCEHHLLPFFGTADVAYIPNGKIVGISKLARTVEYNARRLNTQERMTDSIAAQLDDKLRPKGVAVVVRARHLCQEMRGIRKPGIETITSSLTGVFKESEKTRAEFLALTRT